MRFHTTLKDIAVSVLVLVSCVFLCLYGMLYLGMGNPGQIAANHLIAALDRGGDYVLSTEQVGRTFFRDLVLHRPVLKHDETEIAEFETVLIKGGLKTLLSSILFGSETIEVSFEKPTVNMNGSAFSPRENNGTVSLSKQLETWWNNNSFMFSAQSMDANLFTDEISIKINDASLQASFLAHQKLPTIQSTIEFLKLSNKEADISLETSQLSMDTEGNLLVSTKAIAAAYRDFDLTFTDLVAKSTLQHIFEREKELSVSLSLSNLKALHPEANLEIPKLTSDVFYETIDSYRASFSFDRLFANRKNQSISVPTSTILFTAKDGLLSVATATKEGETLTYSLSDKPLLSALNLNLSASYSIKEGDALARLSLKNALYEKQGVNASVEDIEMLASAKIQDSSLVQASAQLNSQATVRLPTDDLYAQFPLQGEFTYRAEQESLSASAVFSSLQSSFTTKPLSTRLSYQSNPLGSQLQAELGYEDNLSIVAVYDIPLGQEGTLHVSSRLEEFPLSVLSPSLVKYAPFLSPYYKDETELIGNLSFQSVAGGGTLLPFDGRLSIDLALLQASVGKLTIDAGFTFQADITGDSVQVESMTLATSGYRLAFSGSTELNYWLPRGTLSLFNTDDGQEMATVVFFDNPPNQYAFKATTPLELSLSIEGTIERKRADLIGGESLLSIFNSVYPLSFSFETDNLILHLSQENTLQFEASLAPPIQATIQANALRLPNSGFFANALLFGNLSFAYTNLHDWNLGSSHLEISDVSYQDHLYTLSTSMTADQQSLTLPDIVLREGDVTYESSVFYRGSDFLSLYSTFPFAPFESAITLTADNEKKIKIALSGDGKRLTTSVDLHSLALDRFAKALSNMVLDAQLVGYTNASDDLSLDGAISLVRSDQRLMTKLEADENKLRLFDSTFAQPDFTYTGTLLEISNAKAMSSGTFNHIRHLSYLDQESHLTYAATLDLPHLNSLFDLPDALQTILQGNADGKLSLSDIQVYGERGFSDGNYAISLSLPSLSVVGDNLNLSYDFKTQHIEANLNPSFGIGFVVDGSLSQQDFGLSFSSIHFPLSLINRTFLKPVFSFLDGTAKGELHIGGKREDVRMYGQLTVDSSRMDLFWLPQDIITMKNVTATIDGNRATTSVIPFFSTNMVTGKTVQGYGQMAATFDGMRLENYEIHADSGDEMLYVWIPMQNSDADIRTYAGGTFNLFGVGFETWLSGDVTVQDTSMTLGIKDLPYWYVANNLTTTDFTMTTGKNVSFFYPNTPNPFIQATITENQKIAFIYNHITDEFNIDGSLSFRSGEIYYFQKNFFITEGSLSLHTDALTGKNQIQPTINLRAKMTDFDSQGNRVDIYLVLRESSLTNLNPQFESIPSKDVAEIMEILGQSILPIGAYGEVNLYSVASLAAAATDVAQRLGYLDMSQTSLLTETIRISLGLDMFSIRSNILQNILFDALPGSNLGISLSPVARYLNNTSIFMGKYVGEQFFLQALLHLTAMDRTKVTRPFISDDLSLDVELSLDWANPLGTLSFFTQPNELSFTNILDTIGFSVTRRIVLR